MTPKELEALAVQLAAEYGHTVAEARAMIRQTLIEIMISLKTAADSVPVLPPELRARNVRVRAAAPTLLAACEQAVKLIGTGHRRKEVLADLRAAITEAKGGRSSR